MLLTPSLTGTKRNSNPDPAGRSSVKSIPLQGRLFQPKTTSHILKLREAFPGQSIFGRSDVMSVIEIKSSRASDLLKDMAEHGIIEPVTGYGKGKYRFIKQQD